MNEIVIKSIIERVSHEDFQKVLSIYNSLSQQEQRWLGSRFIESPKCVFRKLIFEDHKPVAFLELYDFHNHFDLFVTFAILKDYRRKGYGRKLMNDAVKFGLKHHYIALSYCVYKDNQPSIKFAKNYGFGLMESKEVGYEYWLFFHQPKYFDSPRESLGYLTPSELNAKMNADCTYSETNGNGKEVSDFKYFRVSAPNTFAKYKLGVCWDYASFEYYWFKDYHPNLEPVEYYIQIRDGEDAPTHTWVTFKENGKVCIFESSWFDYQGITCFKNEKEMLGHYKDLFIRSYTNKYKRIPKNEEITILKFVPPLKEISGYDYMKYVYQHGTLIMAGKKSKDLLKQKKYDTIICNPYNDTVSTEASYQDILCHAMNDGERDYIDGISFGDRIISFDMDAPSDADAKDAVDRWMERANKNQRYTFHATGYDSINNRIIVTDKNTGEILTESIHSDSNSYETKTKIEIECEVKNSYHTLNGAQKDPIPQLILHKNGKNYRVRSEILVFQDDKVLLRKKNKVTQYGTTYVIPGGGIDDPDECIEVAAARECNEEAKVVVSNVKFSGEIETGLYGKKIPEWHKKTLWLDGIKYDGYWTYICTGIYSKKYTKYVKKVDSQADIANQSHWYTFDEVKDILTPKHRKLFKEYLSSHGIKA